MKLKQSKLTYSLLFGVILSSCSQEELIVEVPLPSEPAAVSPYSIPADSALAYLKDFMQDQSDTRASEVDHRSIGSITPIKYKPHLTRSGAIATDCDNLLYIANFEDEQGFAVLAADTRIGEKVIAITDQGSLSDESVYAAMSAANTERTILPEYPKTGPGFFTVPETGGLLTE